MKKINLPIKSRTQPKWIWDLQYCSRYESRALSLTTGVWGEMPCCFSRPHYKIASKTVSSARQFDTM